MMRIVLAALLAALAQSVYAQVTVKEAWIRATAPQQKATSAYMQLTSAVDARLVDVRSPIAGKVEVHETRLVDNMMRMRRVESIALPARKTVGLEPGGYHIMLLELERPMKEGEQVPLTLVVEGKDGKRAEVEVKALVRPLTAHGGAHHGH